MAYTVKKLDPINVIGMQLNVANPEQAISLIGDFWQRFRRNDIKELIPNKIKPEHTIAVYTNYNVDLGYDLILGARVQHTLEVPADMVALTIPEQTYAVFSRQGALPDVIINTWQEIWDAPVNRAYTYDFELYKNESLDTAEVEFYITLKPDYTQAD